MFNVLVNWLSRAVLHLRRGRKVTRFTVHARPLGVRQGMDYDRIGRLVEQLEGPLHR